MAHLAGHCVTILSQYIKGRKGHRDDDGVGVASRGDIVGPAGYGGRNKAIDRGREGDIVSAAAQC